MLGGLLLIMGLFLEHWNDKKAENGQLLYANRWSNFYQSADSVELLVIGSSHAYRSYYPPIIDSISGKVSYNLGSSSQTLQTSFYVLLEALRTSKAKTVILDVYFANFIGDAPGWDQLVNGSYNYYFMEPSAIRERFFSEGFDWQQQIKLVWPGYMHRSSFYKMLSDVNKPIETNPLKLVKGYQKNDGTIEADELVNKNEFHSIPFPLKSVKDHQLAFLDSIVTTCEKRGIKLIAASTPLPSQSVSYIQNYEEITHYLDSTFQSKKVEYHRFEADDLNLLDLHFEDNNHLNHTGSKIFTAQLMNKIKDRDS